MALDWAIPRFVRPGLADTLHHIYHVSMPEPTPQTHYWDPESDSFKPKLSPPPHNDAGRVQRLTTLSLLVALGATDDEIPIVFQHIQNTIIHDDPMEALDFLRFAIDAVRNP